MTHNQKEDLTLTNPRYKAAVEAYVFDELARDVGAGDLTTETFFDEKKKIKAVIIAKEGGVVAGLEEVLFFLKTFKDVTVTVHVKEGAKIISGQKIITLKGSVHTLMKIERIILNVLGRMSGIATYTDKLVKKVPRQILITPTRKTLWGLLDKRACVVGGGGTHRLSLDDAILVKHNHLKASGLSMEKFMKKILNKKPKGTFLEIEVKNQKDARTVAATFVKLHEARFPLPCILMFDNMPPSIIKKEISYYKGQKWRSAFSIEASGGITEKNILSYAKTGVDIISMGALTHSAPHLDLTMRVL